MISDQFKAISLLVNDGDRNKDKFWINGELVTEGKESVKEFIGAYNALTATGELAASTFGFASDGQSEETVWLGVSTIVRWFMGEEVPMVDSKTVNEWLVKYVV